MGSSLNSSQGISLDPDGATRGRKRVVFLGILGLLFGGGIGAVAAAPQWIEGRAGEWIADAFATERMGSLRFGTFELAWFDEQRIQGVELLDPVGRPVGRADVRAPRLLALAFSWFGASQDLGEVDLLLEADLVEDDDGVTNLERALALRDGVDPEPEGGGPGDWTFRVKVRADRLTWEDARIRTASRDPIRFESLAGVLSHDEQGLASLRLEGALTDGEGSAHPVYLAADVHGAWRGEGDALPLVDVHGRAEGFPTGMIEALFGGTDSLRRGIGDRLDLEGRARGTSAGGSFDGRIAGDRGAWGFEGRVEAPGEAGAHDVGSAGSRPWLRHLSLTLKGEDRGGLADLLSIPREQFRRDFGERITLVAEPGPESAGEGWTHDLHWQSESNVGEAVVEWSLGGDPRVRAEGSWEGLPVAWIDGRVGADGLLSEALGTEFRLGFEGALPLGGESSALAEAVGLELQSQRARIRFDGVAEASRLTAGDGGRLSAELTLGPLVRARVVEGLLPFLNGVEGTSPATRDGGASKVGILVEDFELPLDGNPAGISGRVRLECVGLRGSFLPGLAALPGGLGERLVFDLPSEPLELHIDRGVVRYSGFEFEVEGERLPIHGAFDLVQGELALGTELPLSLLAGRLRGELGQALALLDPETRIPIEIGGTPASPKLSLASDFLQRAVEDAVRKKAEAGLLEIFRRR